MAGFSLTPVPKSNGYNTEYIIKDAEGNNWTQLAILFPAENPKFARKRTFQTDLLLTERQVAELTAQLKKLPKTKNTLQKRKDLQSKILEMRGRGSELRRKIGVLDDPEKYTHFSYIPYREGLNTPENQKKGFDYLSDTMRKTYDHSVGNSSI